MAYHFDRGARRFGQISLIAVIGIGYVVGSISFIYAGAFMLGAALFAPILAPQLQLYKLMVSRRLIQTDIHDEDATPHRFAQQMGFGMLSGAVIASIVGLSGVAWIMALVVLVLALVNVTTGFCAGCFVHAQIARVRR
jgi:hypothetical protein